MNTRSELLGKWENEINNIVFIEGWTNRQIKRLGINRIHYAFRDAQHECENVIQEYNFVKQRQFTNDIIVFDDVTKNKFDGVCKAVEAIEKQKLYKLEYISSSDNRGYAIARKI